MRRGLLVVAAMPAEMPRGLAPLGVSNLVVGPRARELARAGLPGKGPVLIVGTCGALVQGLPLGSLVLASEVVDEQGALAPDPSLRQALVRAAAGAGVRIIEDRLVQADALVDDLAARSALASRSRAAFVDLESARIARSCEAGQRPWAVLRIISDAPESSLGWLQDLMGSEPTDQPNASLLVSRLLRRPWLLPRLVSLGRLVGRGRRSVRTLLAALPD